MQDFRQAVGDPGSDRPVWELQREPKDLGLDSDALSRLDASVQGDIDRDVNHGATIMVARGEQVGHLRTFGHADKAAGRATSVDDIYLLMSTAKSYTAGLVLRLIDHGRLTFDTKVADVIPEFGVRGKQRVTVAQLLTHTGGTWAGFMPPPPGQWGASWGDMDEMTRLVAAQPIAHRPGERVIYNPFASFGLLGEIVRRLDGAGRSFRQIASEQIFQPLGMVDSPGRTARVPRHGGRCLPEPHRRQGQRVLGLQQGGARPRRVPGQLHLRRRVRARGGRLPVALRLHGLTADLRLGR